MVTMEDIYQILSDNLVRLRKSKQLTQAELADILKYSDKTVSKWENGEALPTLETLVRISDFYNIPIDNLLKESVDTDEYHQIEKIRKTNKAVIALLGVLAVWVIAIVTFVIGCIRSEPVIFWQIFIWAVPVSFMLGIIFSSLWNRKLIYLLLSLFLWTFLTAIFLQFLSKNLYMIFLLEFLFK